MKIPNSPVPILAAVTTVGVAVFALATPIPAAKAQETASASPYAYLNQNWSSEKRAAWYVTPQGSLMMPYDWWFALEDAGGKQLFKDTLTRYGILPGPATSMNPDHLPLGFAKGDLDQPYLGIATKAWIGPTCAACHTSALRYKKSGDATETTLLLEGGQSNIDYGAFRDAMSAAITRTNQDTATFNRFAGKVLAKTGDTLQNREKLRTEFTLYAAQMVKEHYNDAKAYPWGPGRIDAFGIIFNRISVLSLGVPENRVVTDAPVSIPFIWNLHRLSHTQWHGETINARDADHLGRNAGEVLGSYGALTVDPSKPVYTTSVDAPNLVMMENWIGELTSPQWPEELLGKIDRTAVTRGQVLYQKNCISCHTVLGSDKSQIAAISPIPLLELGTDPNMTVNFHTRMVQTGVLRGQPLGKPDGPKFGATARMMDVMNYLATRWDVNTKAGMKVEPYNPLPQDLPAYRDNVNNWGYEAKPLHGIWATAPFLHNGSVPNLYQLLLPAAQRVKTFNVGTLSFDPVNVGYQTDTRFGGKVFDTTLPGNRNSGHEYGTTLSDDERRDLIEYIKTL